MLGDWDVNAGTVSGCSTEFELRLRDHVWVRSNRMSICAEVVDVPDDGVLFIGLVIQADCPISGSQTNPAGNLIEFERKHIFRAELRGPRQGAL